LSPHRLKSAAFALALGSALLVGCGENEPPPPEPQIPEPEVPESPQNLKLFVAVRLDPDFEDNREFTLELVPTDAAGNSLINSAWTITSTFFRPQGTTGQFLSQQVQVGDGKAFAAVIDIDESSSVGQSDPQRLRATASQIFWNTVLNDQSNQVALADFGVTTPTAPFRDTRLLQPLTADKAALDAKLPEIRVFNGTSSPLYNSALEISRWLVANTDAATTKRAVVLMSDGLPNDQPEQRDSLLEEAKAAGVRLYTVGLGPASDRGGATDPAAVAVMRRLSNETGGLYAGAPTAEDLATVLQAFANSTQQGPLLARFKLDQRPPEGYTVGGVVKLAGSAGTVEAPWSFVAP
jgi:hypothetical protein